MGDLDINPEGGQADISGILGTARIFFYQIYPGSAFFDPKNVKFIIFMGHKYLQIMAHLHIDQVILKKKLR
jgi:hypothetical protein